MFATGSVWDYWRVFVNGLVLTVELSFIALVLGFVLGMVIGLGRTYGPHPVRLACLVFTESFRSIPPLLLFFGAFYGLSYTTGVTLSPFQASVIAMVLEASAFISEVVRAAFRSVDRGQWDAARALGLRFWPALRTIIGPQAIRVLIPPTIGVYVAVLKDSSFASIVGLVELTRAGLLVRETVGDSLTVFLLLSGIYFVINFTISSGALALERRFRFAH
ncbi:amino acid ABC transporter permease [Limobrevibacterium gyesilva]|uniref:Amino acid ABC transporter permease n=1 Tax=Limobrevibacterium gyesilva TaxID=2991712 RepID=A0AA41YQ61_9PROT|nr:amino acid ABC transporter permease [Limobrevibacterium gyesilva]MCW3474593.1 amino acid ABC transporter permease [Limobrevibacterium gyesilva]